MDSARERLAEIGRQFYGQEVLFGDAEEYIITVCITDPFPSWGSSRFPIREC